MLPRTCVAVQVARDASGSSKQVLRAVSGSAPAGQLVGLLGPSGSGKSSLLEVLAAGGCNRRGRGAELVAGKVRSY
jgi:ABC-type multidrug transport system ATPase subunit